MDNDFATSPQADDDSELQDELASSETEEHSIKPPEGLRLSQQATVYPPKPCDRCMRMNRTCKGIAGSRCEYCKKLKQKCSNATGPARGRHATRLAILAAAAARGISLPQEQQSQAASSASSSVRSKRKAADGAVTPNGQGVEDDECDDDEYDDHDHEPPVKLNKKHRSTKTALSPAQTKMLDTITELEGTVRELQNHTAREVERIKQVIGRLKADIRELE
ncbi:hypothetical protein AGABI2DRAFT_135177 [Agaricus bisporus var. bisporus H97]|uniref:hypothetical protein n=1 Tax=Agaricus bisporus var. bisporus (strain H97 / ATCC MYA-4626 / FGSC 10389) TaxID=936046 RepID=UPI00029F738D|nr:hypothetical protein AGABI2DRAFT_135177 [Agaricus bisporus var. bisporus H97]EKV48042.1 hypothetical protein AGABI2DRAFT_135177 [Agaricus bisporus var. bisporus H97]